MKKIWKKAFRKGFIRENDLLVIIIVIIVVVIIDDVVCDNC